MTKAQLVARVDRWRLLLAPEWRIEIHEAPLDDEPCRGEIKAAGDYHSAELYLAPDMVSGDVAELDVLIVHELLHLLMREMRRTLDMVNGQVHRDIHSLVSEYFNTAEEQAVERLARVICRAVHPDGVVYGVMMD